MTPREMRRLYNANTRTIRTRRGWSIQCRKGLWAVEAPSLVKAEREALHYFQQYFADGEYAAPDRP